MRAAVVETASPAALPRLLAPRIEGAGLVQAVGATATEVTVHGDEDGQMGLLSFGVAELTRDFHDERDLIVRNHGHWPATFTVTATSAGGVPHTVRLSSSTVAVRGHDETHAAHDAGRAGERPLARRTTPRATCASRMPPASSRLTPEAVGEQGRHPATCLTTW